MALLPPSDEWKAATYPAWALGAMLASQRVPLAVGMTVFDVLYGGYHGMAKFGVVRSVSEDGRSVVVDYPGGCSRSLSEYWVPVPQEHIKAIADVR